MSEIPSEAPPTSFQELGVVGELCDACRRVGYKTPTPIQIQAIPQALKGHDVIGVAKTGSGKTAAYALPMIQSLLSKPKRLFGIVITPTRELAFQVKDHIQALGSQVGVDVAVLCGGMDMKAEQVMLHAKPHIIVATPGRLLDHLERTKNFTLEHVKYLVFDEADRILGVDLEKHMNKILKVLPQDRRTMLFSATMNKSTQELQRTSLIDPVKVKVSETFETVDTLQQYMKAVPLQQKIANMVWFLNELKADKDMSKTFIIFCSSKVRVLKVHICLSQLSFNSIPIYGKLEQNKRMGALHKFKANERNILVATDVASRGLDIPGVDWVVNFDLPESTKDYIHRVGRTARAGRMGKSFTFTTPLDVVQFYLLEKKLKVTMQEYVINDSEVQIMAPSVQAAENIAEENIVKMQESEALSKSRNPKRKSSSAKRGKHGPKKSKGDVLF